MFPNNVYFEGKTFKTTNQWEQWQRKGSQAYFFEKTNCVGQQVKILMNFKYAKQIKYGHIVGLVSVNLHFWRNHPFPLKRGFSVSQTKSLSTC